MKSEDSSVNSQIALFASTEHDCSYLPDHISQLLFVDPTAEISPLLYDALLSQGFRRSGDHVYRPACPGCAKCVSVRVPVSAFAPSRTQQRILRKNADLEVIEKTPSHSDEQYVLYKRYLQSRHPGGGMEEASEEDYLDFLYSNWSNTRFCEFRLQNKLLGVAVVDVLTSGLSAVYTFFDPDYPKRSLGAYAILWEIERAKALQRPFLYLGYWIAKSRKMSYKEKFLPQERYINGSWTHFSGK